jgi:hypothetical protein
MHSLEPEEEDYLFCPSLDWDDVYPEETFGDRLRLFYSQFNSSTRALLDASLFREVAEKSSVTGLEILCKNSIIYKRLTQKHQKIGNEIRWIWPETVNRFEILVPYRQRRGCANGKRLPVPNGIVGSPDSRLSPTQSGSANGRHSPDWCGRMFQLPEYWLK